ncbi:hypothetical protein [Streptomyces tsukubensis]|uniref:DUF8017 domain-containing protein n=1 Tax=Streptomyces tsukubensis TaxID=83656 RepID=A0A1V4A6C0_9ACTN|nr:hypothetical protein [Streptomyces tsukubensis]OON77356.1 hypothetical protein B1H18_19165 [Streptomyces tsukubensis]QFR92438.1 hypothetical protein GBW32_04385 [Streptomyces tsukubensis]
MWPGQQPPGGEQNPQDPNDNPYQQAGYQQPNPYQQPGYQQPNPYQQPAGQPAPQPGQQQPGPQMQGQQPGYPPPPYAAQQQPGQQWGAPTMPSGARPPGGGGGKKTKVVAIVAASAVVVAAAVTGVLVLGGGGEDDEAGRKPAVSKAPTHSSKEKRDAGGSTDDSNPRGNNGGVKPVIIGWQVVVNQRFGTVFDVPPGWELASTDTSVGFEWDEDGKTDRTSVTAPAYLQSKWCTGEADKDGRKEDTALAVTGTRGENGAKDAASAAIARVPWWVFGGYTQPDRKSITFTKQAKPYTTKSGLEGSVTTAESAHTPQHEKCDSDGKAITFAFTNSAGDIVSWNLYGAKGVKDELDDATIRKILSSVRLSEEEPTGS